MSDPFRQKRCIELSTIDHIETQIDANWDGVTVVMSFANAYKETGPTVSIELSDTERNSLEVGTTQQLKFFQVNIDIFGVTKGEGFIKDMSDFLVDDVLKDGWVYYDYSDGSGNTLNKVANGRIQVSDWITDARVRSGESSSKHDKYRHSIVILVRKK